MKQNITLSLDKELLTKLRVIAAQRSSSVSRLLAREAEQLVDRTEHYAQAKRQALDLMEQGFHLGGRPADRKSLHER